MSKPKLTKKDWAEIYYALKSKVASPTVKGDQKWIAHLNRIMKKIGPDGQNMVSEETTKHYLLVVYGDVEPGVEGPFKTDEKRDERAKEVRKEEGDESGIYGLDVKNGVPDAWPYGGDFFEDDNEGEEEEEDHG